MVQSTYVYYAHILKIKLIFFCDILTESGILAIYDGKNEYSNKNDILFCFVFFFHFIFA